MENLRAEQTSVWVACAFMACRLIFSINIGSVGCCCSCCCWIDCIVCGIFANGSIVLSGSRCGCCCCCNNAWWWWCWWWCAWCVCSGELDAFLPPIKRSWLFAVFNRVDDRRTHTSSNEVKVCERAKLTCFVLSARKKRDDEKIKFMLHN